MTRMVTRQELVATILGKVRTPAIPYREGWRSDKGTDCINLIGWCMDELGGRKVSRGSNAAWRDDVAWTGTLAEAKAQGKLLPGALLYIDYGGGAMDHVGVYVGEGRGLVTPDGKPGDVVHASQSRGGVYPSTRRNGWTHVAWIRGVEYGAGDAQEVGVATDTEGKGEAVTPTPAPPALPAEPGSGQARVETKETGLRLRKLPSIKGAPICEMPKGAIINILDTRGRWAEVWYMDARSTPHVGWCSMDFLEFGGVE